MTMDKIDKKNMRKLKGRGKACKEKGREKKHEAGGKKRPKSPSQFNPQGTRSRRQRSRGRNVCQLEKVERRRRGGRRPRDPVRSTGMRAFLVLDRPAPHPSQGRSNAIQAGNLLFVEECK